MCQILLIEKIVLDPTRVHGVNKFDWHCNDKKSFAFKSLIMYGFILALEQRKPPSTFFPLLESA